MRWILALGAAALLASGCATGTAPGDVTASVAAPTPIGTPAKPTPRSRTFRLGFWELDLLALDLEPRGTTVRLVDLRIVKVLEVGAGKDYHSFSVAELPGLFNALTTRHEGRTHEHRLVDVQALAAAAGRSVRESESKAEHHFLKVPVLGSFYGHEMDGGADDKTFLYLFRYETER